MTNRETSFSFVVQYYGGNVFRVNEGVVHLFLYVQQHPVRCLALFTKQVNEEYRAEDALLGLVLAK